MAGYIRARPATFLRAANRDLQALPSVAGQADEVVDRNLAEKVAIELGNDL